MSTEVMTAAKPRNSKDLEARRVAKEFDERTSKLSLPAGIKVGALLIHGLTGMPNEMRPLAERLEGIGCQVAVPMLPGHGAGQKELLATGWKDWLGGARQALNELCTTCDTVVISGLSMGGLLSIFLAIENPKVAGIIAMSPTLKYDSVNSSNPFKVLLPLLDIVPFLGKYFYWIKRPPFGLKDERLQRKIIKELEKLKKGSKDDSSGFNPEQFRTYAASLRDIQRLVKEVKREAPQLRCPALIIQSVEDTITTKWNAETLYSWIGSDDKRIIYVDGCDHVLPMDLKKEEVAYHHADFICNVAAAARQS